MFADVAVRADGTRGPRWVSMRSCGSKSPSTASTWRRPRRVLASRARPFRDHVIEGRYVSLTGAGPTLSLQRVLEPKSTRNRLHLDLLVDDADAEVARLQALGAVVLPPRGLRGVRAALVRADRPGRQRVLRGRER